VHFLPELGRQKTVKKIHRVDDKKEKVKVVPKNALDEALQAGEGRKSSHDKGRKSSHDKDRKSSHERDRKGSNGSNAPSKKRNSGTPSDIVTETKHTPKNRSSITPTSDTGVPETKGSKKPSSPKKKKHSL
jgi:hypothetical protein